VATALLWLACASLVQAVPLPAPATDTQTRYEEAIVLLQSPDRNEFAKGFDRLYSAASDGHRAAQLSLSIRLREAARTADPTTRAGMIADANRWINLAGEAGDANAQYELGLMHASGTDVDRDVYKAARWFQLAAQQGHALAQYFYGLALIGGTGVVRDQASGMRMMRNAADQGQREAIDYLNAMQDRQAMAAEQMRRRLLDQFERERQLGAQAPRSASAPRGSAEANWQMGMLEGEEPAGLMNKRCFYKTLLGFEFSTVDGVLCKPNVYVDPVRGTVKTQP
jgi:TPR repeat protein